MDNPNEQKPDAKVKRKTGIKKTDNDRKVNAALWSEQQAAAFDRLHRTVTVVGGRDASEVESDDSQRADLQPPPRAERRLTQSAMLAPIQDFRRPTEEPRRAGDVAPEGGGAGADDEGSAGQTASSDGSGSSDTEDDEARAANCDELTDEEVVMLVDPRLKATLKAIGFQVVLDGNYNDIRLRPDDRGVLLLRKRVWNLLEGQLNFPAFVFRLFIMGVVILSTVNLLVQSDQVYALHFTTTFFAIEAAVTAVLTLTWLAKFVSCQKPFRDFLLTSWAIFDFICLLPFYFELAFGYYTAFTIIRSLRFVMVFGILSNYSDYFGALLLAIRRSVQGLAILVVLIMMLLIFLSTLMYWAERAASHWDAEQQTWIRSDGEPSPFDSISVTMYWAITTITTTGYGDVAPLSAAGRAVAAVSMIIGILVLAFPVTIFSSRFKDASDELEIRRQVAMDGVKTHRLQTELDGGGAACTELEMSALRLLQRQLIARQMLLQEQTRIVTSKLQNVNAQLHGLFQRTLKEHRALEKDHRGAEGQKAAGKNNGAAP